VGFPVSTVVPPANATVTVSKVVHTVTNSVRSATHTVARHTVTTPHLPSITAPPLTSVLNIIGGIAIIIAIIAVIGYLVLKRIKVGGRSVAAAKLSSAVNDPSVDAVGLILDIDTRSAKFVPLKEVENMYVTVDPNVPASVVVRNPHAMRFTVDGKPLIIAPAISRTAIEVDAPSMTVLGLGSVAVDDPAWHDTVTPNKSFEDLITKLSTIIGRKRGSIKLTPKMSLGFEMSVPKLIMAMLSANLYLANILLTHMTDITQVIDRLAEQLGLLKVKESQIKMSSWSKIFITAGAVLMAILIGWGIFNMLSHGGR